MYILANIPSIIVKKLLKTDSTDLHEHSRKLLPKLYLSSSLHAILPFLCRTLIYPQFCYQNFRFAAGDIVVPNLLEKNVAIVINGMVGGKV